MQPAISKLAAISVAALIVVVAGFGVYLNQNGGSSQVHTVSSSENHSSISPENTLLSTASNSCYSAALPSNETTTNQANSAEIMIFNVTSDFDAGNWISFLGNSVHLSSYTFYAYTLYSTTTSFQLEPQLFVNVTESGSPSGIQKAAWTDLGNWAGNTWPPDMSPSNVQVLFGGKVNMEFLFLCNTQGVFFEIGVS